MPTPNLSVDSILRFLLVMLQYVEQVYQIYWYLIGMFIGRFVYFLLAQTPWGVMIPTLWKMFIDEWESIRILRSQKMFLSCSHYR